jgi:hypothetical protein
MSELNKANETLRAISQQIYGERLELRIVDPKSVRLLKKNARYMPKEVFDQLTRNVERDGQMESTPLCHTLKDGTLEVISGNHRIEAAIKAKLKEVLVMVIPRELKPGERIAKQLSHNAIAGQDDKHLLAELWREMDTIEEKLYSGLDSKVIEELEKVKFSGFGPEQIRTEQVMLWFLPEEIESIEKVLTALDMASTAKRVYLAPLSHYQKLFDLIVAKKKSDNIKNTAVAFMTLIDELWTKYENEKPAVTKGRKTKAEKGNRTAVKADPGVA